PHRRAQPIEAAAAVLRAERGRQFDPHVLDAFLDGLDDAAATLRRYPDAPATAGPDEYVTLQVAAQTLGASASQLRRWSNEGRITAARTAGGHRRFRLEDVRRLAAEIGALPRLRPIDPPQRPLPETAATLKVFGTQIIGAAAQSIYPSGPYGWLASAKADGDRRTWLTALQTACEHGTYAPALAATDVLLALSRTHGTTLLERHAFLERLGQVLTRALGRQGVDQRELPEVRRLIVALQQNALQTYG
ncbi:MAG: helix-turn-helix domain-containing protein, partial [Solirubrobacterales bacterium]